MRRLTMALCLILLLCSCGRTIDYTLLDDPAARITSEAFDDNLRIDYGVSSLLRHEIYLKDGLLETQFYFDEAPTPSHLEALRMFMINKFIYRSIDNYGWSDYDTFLRERIGTKLADRFALVIVHKDKIDRVEIYNEKLQTSEPGGN